MPFVRNVSVSVYTKYSHLPGPAKLRAFCVWDKRGSSSFYHFDRSTRRRITCPTCSLCNRNSALYERARVCHRPPDHIDLIRHMSMWLLCHLGEIKHTHNTSQWLNTKPTLLWMIKMGLCDQTSRTRERGCDEHNKKKKHSFDSNWWLMSNEYDCHKRQ